MKTVLVTGGCGFIGSHFVRLLFNRTAWRVVNLDKLTYAGDPERLKDIEEGDRYRQVRGDIADQALVDRVFQEERPWAVVNFAADSHVDRSILDPSPFLETNVMGTQVLLEASRRWKVERFLQIGTDEVYGSVEEGCFTETSPLDPSSPYAASKAAADLLCLAYWRTYGLPILIVRSTNNYGPYQFPEKLIPLMIVNALQGKSLPVYGRGENVRDWLYVEDNCCAIALVLERGRIGEIYNIGAGEGRRNLKVVELICALMARRLQRPAGELKELITFVKDRPGHDFRYSLDCTKIREELGWAPATRFEEGLERTIGWYVNHQDWVERVISGEYQEYYARVYAQGWR